MPEMDRLEQARQLFLDALAMQEKGDFERAERLYREALVAAPGRPSVMNNLATVCIELKKYLEARLLCERLLELNPADETALLNLGNCRLKQGLPAEALARYDHALRIKPGYEEALNGRGNALLELNRPGEALASYERALAIRPDYAEALYNLGSALLELARPEQALTSLDRALTLKPDHAEAHNNRGNALLQLGRAEEALASYDRALVIQPDYAEVLNNRGDALQALGQREELIENYRALLRVRPDHDYAIGYLLRAQLQCCVWGDYDDETGRISQAVRAGKRADAPYDFLVISESADDQLLCARTFAADKHPVGAQPVWQGERYRHSRTRVAYLSGDLRNHAVAYLIAGLFEAHDRTRFEITALSFSPGGTDEMGKRLVPAFDRFVNIGQKSDREVALILRELEIDIAVDLQGYTKGCRPGIFAQRAAPVQVNYLGYPGTMGAPYMDYIIGDRMVIPPEQHSCYSEKVVYLPDCYQANDSRRGMAPHIPTRAQAGLPAEGFVFCCFNNNHKINPRVFGIWMRLLQEVEESVIWLLEDNPVAARNLRREAERRGVAPQRVVFAPRVKMEEHLARQRLADLFLDTLPYNAHVTASDALWVGLPVLTCLGHTFAGRVAASLLTAVGLPELITRSWGEYEALALKLAADGNRLADIRATLARNRTTQPLFDTDRYRRHIEAAYATMWERAQRGEPAVSFSVSAEP
jgi:protein O-GlcNAc transferase